MGYGHDERDRGARSVPGRVAHDGGTGAVPGRATLVQRAAVGAPRPATPDADPHADVLAQLEGSASAGLPGGLRGELEQALGTGLADVRIHTSGAAASAASAIDAQAFAV